MPSKALLLILCFAGCWANSQSTSAIQPPTPSATISPKLHEETLKLVEVSGARQRLLDQVDKAVTSGQKAMMDQCPKCAPAFGEEWAKRMKQRYPVEDFLAAYVAVYERYLSDDEVLQLIDRQTASTVGKPGTLSPALVERLNALMPTILGEIAGRCTQIGAKLGAEIGIEIQREHPDYLESSKPDAAKP